MTRKKPVKVRKWVTCAEPGCKRRAGTSKPYCGEHQKKFEKEKAAAAKKRALRVLTTCMEPGCRRRTFEKNPYCKEHLEKWNKKHLQAQKSDAKKKKKAAAAAKRKNKREADKKEAARVAELVRKPRLVPGQVLSRLIKAHCEKCGYTIRLSKKWIEVRRPMCPACMRNMVTAIDGDAGADPRQLKLKGGV